MKGHNPHLWIRQEPMLQTDFLVRERIPHWLGNVEGVHILDIACGEGYISRKLASLGAIVEAFDMDSRMIELAKSAEKGRHHLINYKVGEISHLNELYSSALFDIAILSGVVCFLDEQELYDCMKKVYNVLNPNGQILVATNHAASFFQKAKSSWLEYLTEPNPVLATQSLQLIFYHPNGDALFSGSCYMHTPQRIEDALNHAGLKIDVIYEPLATSEDIKKTL